MNELTALANKYGSDKGSLKHNYTEHYFKYLEPYKRLPVHLFEIGVDKGASIKMWLDFLPDAFITGLDLLPCPECLISAGRYTHVQGSQIVVDDLRSVGVCCIIIDDGSHNYADIFYTLGVMAVMINCDLYFVEDLGAKRAGNAMADLKRYGFKELAPQLAVKEFV